MSGLRPHTMTLFFKRLHRRGVFVADLARAVGRNRATVTRVLNGSRRRGPLWPKLKELLQPEEIELLDVALRDSWNKERIAKRPKWESRCHLLVARDLSPGSALPPAPRQTRISKTILDKMRATA